MLPTVIAAVEAEALPPRPSETVTAGVKLPPCVKIRVKLAFVDVEPSPTVHAYVKVSESGSLAVAVIVNVVKPWIPKAGDAVALTVGARFACGCGCGCEGVVGWVGTALFPPHAARHTASTPAAVSRFMLGLLYWLDSEAGANYTRLTHLS
jgi:hypothetical protein